MLNERLECNICNETYENIVEFALHSIDHADDMKYSCHLCDYRDSSKDNIENHVETHIGSVRCKCDKCDKVYASNNGSQSICSCCNSEGKPYQCEICKKRFVRKKSWIIHRRSQRCTTQLIKYNCNICDRNYRTVRDLRRHNLRLHNINCMEEFVACETCGKRIPKELLHFHIRIHTACRICGKQFPKREELKRHLITHSENTPHCKICDKYYVTSQNLRAHQRLIHNVFAGTSNLDDSECKFCHKHFKTPLALKRHNRRNHQLPGTGTISAKQLVLCDICGKSYTKDYLEYHRRVHSGYKPFKCDICAKNFKRREQLKEHRRIHTGEKPYVCQFCGKAFSQRSPCRVHEQRMHPNNIVITNDSPSKTNETTSSSIICDICGKSLYSKYYLEYHLRIHTGYKPYTCEFCGKSFTKNEQLTEHRRVHTGERPYVCGYCGNAYTQRTSLCIHERVHTGERPYKCDICQEGFIRKSAMDKHMKVCSVNVFVES